MRPNPVTRIAQETEAAAARATSSLPAGSSGTIAFSLVGTNHPTSGEWFAFGRLGITTFGEGFYLSNQVRV